MQDLINKIHHADCLDFMRSMPDKCVDLVLTDPPYGINYDKVSNEHSVRGKPQSAKAEWTKYEYKEWDSEIPEDDIFDEIFRVSKNQIIFGGNYFTNILYPTRSWIIWNKKGDGRFSNDYADGEMAWSSLGKNMKIYHFLWSGMMQENMKDKEIRIHPTQKPVGLFNKILSDFSKDNDIILDCFSGSGTTAVSCHVLNRRFICIEKDKDYYEKSVKRLEDARRQLKLF